MPDKYRQSQLAEILSPLGPKGHVKPSLIEAWRQRGLQPSIKQEDGWTSYAPVDMYKFALALTMVYDNFYRIEPQRVSQLLEDVGPQLDKYLRMPSEEVGFVTIGYCFERDSTRLVPVVSHVGPSDDFRSTLKAHLTGFIPSGRPNVPRHPSLVVPLGDIMRRTDELLASWLQKQEKRENSEKN